MDFSFDDEQLALREAVLRWCEGEYPATTRGNPEDAATAARRRDGMATLGLSGLTLPADHGGSGLGAVEAMVVAQELGRALADGSFIASTVMAGGLIARLGTPQQQARWLPALAEGRLLAAPALLEDGIRHDWQDSLCAARPGPQGWVLDGRKTHVPLGDSAGLWLVLARTTDAVGDHAGLSLFAVDAGTPGLHVQDFATLDGRRAAHLTLHSVQVPADRLLGTAGGTSDAVEAAVDAGAAALVAEAVGALESLLTQTAEHLRTRRQFGAPLAKFQVLQHRVADLVIALEQLKSMACAAAMAVDAGEPAQRRRIVSAAKALAGQHGRAQGMAAIQMHGAMGMTDECRIGHVAKRLLVIGQQCGDATWHLQRLADAA